MIKKKILAIVYRKRNDKEEILALRQNDKDEIQQSVGLYVITGGVEEDESLTEAVKREIEEETGMKNIINIQDLNTVYEYKHPAEGNYLCQEHCFAVLVDEDVIQLNDEHTEYKWLAPEDFTREIYWYSDKSALSKLLNKFIRVDYN